MKLPRLKKGLFGYTESSVRDYIERVDEEIKAKVGFLTDENTSLRQECADLQKALADVKGKRTVSIPKKRSWNSAVRCFPSALIRKNASRRR